MAEPRQHNGRAVLEGRREVKPLNLGFEPYDFCPLRCNSCPQGRREVESTHRNMTAGQLERMLGRISGQRRINTIELIGWGEPLLNPALPELVRVGNRYGNTWISTTGNHWKCDLKELVESRPQRFSVSISGWSQDVHQCHHEAGDIEKAKGFMETLASYGMRFSIIFHRYNNNLHEEPAARAFARKVGAKFEPIWGRHHPVEDLIEEKGNPYLIVPIPEQLAEARRQKPYTCLIQTNHVQIGAEGEVRGCVAARDRTVVGNVLTDTMDEVMAAKERYSLCDSCYKAGVHKIICAQTIGHDATYAKHAGGTAADRLRWFWERCKKRTWVNRD